MVTGNNSDFCGQDPTTLDQALLDDLNGLVKVVRQPSLEDLLAAMPGPSPAATNKLLHGLLGPSPEEAQEQVANEEVGSGPLLGNLREAVISACQELVGQDLEDRDEPEHSTGLSFTEVDIPRDLQNITVQDIEPDLDTLDWEAYDGYRSSINARVYLQAEVQLDGFMFKADYYAAESAVELHDGDWNDHMVFAYIQRRVRLTFNAAIDQEAGYVEAYFRTCRVGMSNGSG